MQVIVLFAFLFLTARKRSLRRSMLLQVSICPQGRCMVSVGGMSVARGMCSRGHVCQEGMHGGEHMWGGMHGTGGMPSPVLGGMHTRRGAWGHDLFRRWGHEWQGTGACVTGWCSGRGCAWQGATCMAGGVAWQADIAVSRRACKAGGCQDIQWGTCVVRGVLLAGGQCMARGLCVWHACMPPGRYYEIQVNEWPVRILLECILVRYIILR